MDDRKSRKTESIQYAINLTKNTWSNIPNHHLRFDNAQLQGYTFLLWKMQSKASNILVPKSPAGKYLNKCSTYSNWYVLYFQLSHREAKNYTWTSALTV